MTVATKSAVDESGLRPHSESWRLPAIGYSLWKENLSLLGDPLLTGGEITFERVDDPLRLGRYLGGLDLAYISVHALNLSPASPEPPARAYLDALLALAEENGAAAVSDHLGFTRDANGGVEIGHFAPPPFTSAALDATCWNLDLIQSYFRSLPFYLENIASLFQFRGTMSEADFLIRVLQRTGCGWLLDVTNLYANSRNHGYDASSFLCQVVPTATRLQIHLSGGYFDAEAGLYMDSHSRPVPDEVWDLYRQALELGRGKVDAVFIERDQNFPDETGWRDELRRAHEIAQAVEAEACMTDPHEPALTYRDEIRRWVPALAGFQATTGVCDALAPGSSPIGLKLFAEGNLKKRREALQAQLEFVAEAFDDLEDLMSDYIRNIPPVAYDTTVSDGERFLSWLERTGALTPRQRDYVSCQRARLAVEAAARADRPGHRRFQELWSLTPQLAAELDLDTDPGLRAYLNPIRAWSRFATTTLLDDDATLPADVLFFAAGEEIRTAVLDPHGRALVEELASCGPCTLEEWAGRSQHDDREELVTLYRDLAEMGLVALE